MLNHIRLERPLCAIDTETTGLLESDPYIVEIAVVKVWPDSSVESVSKRIRPAIPIPPRATEVHGITDDQVAGCRSWRDFRDPFLHLIDGADLTGFNLLGYDIPVINGEMRRLISGAAVCADRVTLDSMRLFHAFFPPMRRGTGTLRRAVGRYLGVDYHFGHGALLDATMSLLVLDRMIPYHGLPGSIKELAEACGQLA